MVQGGPTDSAHLPGINFIRLGMQRRYGEVRVGVRVEVQKWAR